MHVFLSYPRRDEGVVKVLAQGLQSARRDVWLDSELGGGEVWWEAILTNIRSSDVFLFALSDAALESKPCRLELDYAIELGKPVLPVLVGPFTAVLANPIADRQIIDFNPQDARSGFAVLAAVDEAAKRAQPLPDPLPTPPSIPYAYLRAVGRQIDSVELSVDEQRAVVDALYRALGDETDEKVRQEILAMLRNLLRKPYTTRRTEKVVTAMLLAWAAENDGQPPRADADPDPERPKPPEPATADGAPEPPTTPIPVPAPVTDPRGWFLERLARIERQSSAPANLDSQFGAGRFGAGRQEPGPGSGGSPAEHWTGPPSFWASTAAQGPAGPAPDEPARHPVRQAAPVAAPEPASDPEPPAPPAPSHRALSILALVLFFPLGLIALYFSAQVERFNRLSISKKARRASTLAKGWSFAGLVGFAIVAMIFATQT